MSRQRRWPHTNKDEDQKHRHAVVSALLEELAEKGTLDGLSDEQLAQLYDFLAFRIRMAADSTFGLGLLLEDLEEKGELEAMGADQIAQLLGVDASLADTLSVALWQSK
ncbi:MAG: hypothetical protein OXK16_03760 [bacterium]|nr:hypothetical protein [bacterium]